MKDFLRLISFLISMTGCLVVGAVMALKGAPLLIVAARAAVTLVVLWIGLRFLSGVLSLVASPHPESGPTDVEDADTETLMAEAS